MPKTWSKTIRRQLCDFAEFPQCNGLLLFHKPSLPQVTDRIPCSTPTHGMQSVCRVRDSSITKCACEHHVR